MTMTKGHFAWLMWWHLARSTNSFTEEETRAVFLAKIQGSVPVSYDFSPRRSCESMNAHDGLALRCSEISRNGKYVGNNNAKEATRELAESKPKAFYMLQSTAEVKRVRSRNSLEALSESSKLEQQRSVGTDRYLN
ncbi:hypothetical protein TSMEX_006588 [Taenia solium]|eukprot:TsM_000400400 transcript=TsM_000400400 gene=TsM_000400400